VKAADQFRASDVTKWGITTLVIWGIAIMGANVSGLIPSSVYAALHASRLDGSTLSQLRSEVAMLQQDAARMKREANELQQRFSRTEESASDVTRRVRALEVSVPKLIEQQFAATQRIDTTSTGSIYQPLTFEVEGGSVEVRQRPLQPDAPDLKFTPAPTAGMPAKLAPAGAAWGVVLGFPVAGDDAEARWQEMLATSGDALEGLSPLLVPSEDATRKAIIAGPIADRATALELCLKLDRQGVPCELQTYEGAPMPLLN
jgi:hypothetical protein